MRIAIIFDNKARIDTTGIYFKKAIEELGYIVEHYNSECYLLDSIPDTYDLYLCIDDSFDKFKPIRKYRNGATAFYAIDTHLTFEKKLEKAKNYDFVFCAQKDGMIKMKSKGINAFWIPLGFDEQIHRKYELKKEYDLAFVGNLNTKERIRLAQRYNNKYKTFMGKVDYKDISRIYSQSKIVLNWPIKNDINMRFFEALGSGSLLLSKRIKNGEDEIAKEGIHYIGFYSHLLFPWLDLDRKIKFYLKNDRVREKIAYEGYLLAINELTYKHRVKKLLEIINIHSGNLKTRKNA